MRKREIVLAVAAGALASGAAALILDADDESGRAVAMSANRTYDVAAFEEVSTSGPQDVVVTQGDKFSVRAQGSPEAVANLEAVVEGGKLVIRPKSGFNIRWGDDSDTTFYVTLPKLTALSVAGSGDVQVDRIEGDRFEGSLLGPGQLSIAAMKVDRAKFSLAGSGDLTVAGTAGETDISALGSGEIEAGGLRSRAAKVSMAGSGEAALSVDEDVHVSILGSGDVSIAGPARCEVTRIGSGDVTCNGSDR